MEWGKIYRPSRKVPIEDIAQAIHDSVTMDEVLAFYAPTTPRRNHRCPCPLHNGKDLNFSYTQNGYKCFVCGASGDVITFVKEVCELSTRVDAMKRLNQDLNLHLPIDGYEADGSELSRLREQAERARKSREELEQWERDYDCLVAEYAALDNIVMFCPQISARCKAKERMAYIGYLIDDALIHKPKG